MKTPKYTVLTRPGSPGSWLVAYAGNSKKLAGQVYLREIRRGRDAYIAVRPEPKADAS